MILFVVVLTNYVLVVVNKEANPEPESLNEMLFGDDQSRNRI